MRLINNDPIIQLRNIHLEVYVFSNAHFWHVYEDPRTLVWQEIKLTITDV